MPYNEENVKRPISEIEEEVLSFWQEEKIFQQSVESRPLDNQFVLYDGPPFATGLPHYGHVLAHTIKDVIPRYQTMQGKRVERRFGWDCHGVPVEYEVEKEQKIQGGAEIEEKMGISAFNEACRSIVQRYTKEWRVLEDRLGRFVDMDNDYKTMDKNFMESVWAIFKKIYDKGLIYQGKKIVAYSPALGTALSDFESKLNYKTIQDPQITLAFRLMDDPKTHLLVWTTTPWSVPTNVAIALNSSISYVKVTTQKDSQCYVLAETAIEKYFKKEEIIKTEKINNDILLGKQYQPLFLHSAEEKSEQCYTIIESHHVTDSDGTGLVHISPVFGEDDYRLGLKYQLPILDYFNKQGCFQVELKELEVFNQKVNQSLYSVKGLFFKDADKVLIKFMKESGNLFHQGTLSHEYPFCWRTDKPLMYRAVPSWYVKVSVLTEKLIANNNLINWYPEHVGKKRFNEWLKNARDWAISRSRYWGAPPSLCGKTRKIHLT